MSHEWVDDRNEVIERIGDERHRRFYNTIRADKYLSVEPTIATFTSIVKEGLAQRAGGTYVGRLDGRLGDLLYKESSVDLSAPHALPTVEQVQTMDPDEISAQMNALLAATATEAQIHAMVERQVKRRVEVVGYIQEAFYTMLRALVRDPRARDRLLEGYNFAARIGEPENDASPIQLVDVVKTKIKGISIGKYIDESASQPEARIGLAIIIGPVPPPEVSNPYRSHWSYTQTHAVSPRVPTPASELKFSPRVDRSDHYPAAKRRGRHSRR